MDRSILGVLAPTLQYKVFNWTDKDYALINISFMVAYALGMLTIGALIDKLGTKIGYTLSIAAWSIFGMLHAAIRPVFGLLGFCVARFGLGLGESGNFPAAIKSVGEWFPKKERALATGIFNAGSNVGAILAPLVIPLIVWPDGTHWQYAFLTTGFFSALWVIIWLKAYQAPERHKHLSAAELAYINSDSETKTTGKKISWAKLLPHRQTWAFACAKITDAVWWFYLFWGGKFLYDQFGLNIKSLALPLITIYLLADIGSVGGGWLSSHFIKRGWAVSRARKTTLFICALCILPVMFSTQLGTKFNVDARFFERLQTAKFTTEHIETVDGRPVQRKVEQSVPAEIQAAMHSLDKKSFKSAKEFTGAAAEVLGATGLASNQTVLLELAAGRFEVTDDFISRGEKALPADISGAVHALHGKVYSSQEAFLEALSSAIGKARVGKMESALISSARSDNLYWIAVLLIALAAGSHQAWSANIFTLVSDVFPKKAIASVTGIGGMVGAVASIIANFTLGEVLASSGPSGYFFAFLVSGSAYMILLGVVHLLMPKMRPLDENLNPIQS